MASKRKAAAQKNTAEIANPDLEANIRARPDADDEYLVYADWLSARGDPRGELIMIQQRLANDPDNSAVRLLESKHLEEHGERLMPNRLGQLLSKARRKRGDLYRCSVTWKLGFIQGVRLARYTDDQPSLGDVVAELLTHPSAKFLRRMALGPTADRRADYRKILPQFVNAKNSILEELIIGDLSVAGGEATDPGGPRSIYTGDPALLFAHLPGLRRLVLRGEVRLDADFRHHELRELVLSTDDLPEKSLQSLIAAEVPSLERLELDCTALDQTSNAFRLLFAQDEGDEAVRLRWPALHTLVLRRIKHVERLLTMLVKSPMFERLTKCVLHESEIRGTAAELEKHFGAEVMSKVILEDATEIPNIHLPGGLSEADVLELAPDIDSIPAARKVAHSDGWRVLARDKDVLWGQYQGQFGFYRVYCKLDASEYGCNCGSFKYPCKHILALLLFAARSYAFVPQSVPAVHLAQAHENDDRYGGRFF